MHGLPQRLQPILGTPDDPLGHAGPAEGHAQLPPHFLLTVQRHGVAILLVHDLRHHRRRHHAVIQQRLFHRSTHNDRPSVFSAVRTLVRCLPVPNQFHLGRDILKGLPHQFLAHPVQSAAALRADLFLRVKVMDAVLGVLRLFQLPFVLLVFPVDTPFVFLVGFRGVRLVFRLRLREQPQRFFLRDRCFLAGTAKLLLPQECHHLVQIPHLVQQDLYRVLQFMNVGVFLRFSLRLLVQQFGKACLDFLHGCCPPGCFCSPLYSKTARMASCPTAEIDSKILVIPLQKSPDFLWKTYPHRTQRETGLLALG